ncbi:MAG: hypothetical protein R3345_11325 [Fulvivirga sp.]|nr:hypothetical protein [Fulvivirga sp.]
MIKLYLFLLCYIVVFPLNAQSIYKINDGDTVLAKSFINELCAAARNQQENKTGPTKFEKLILQAANTHRKAPLSGTKTQKWHSQYADQIYCEANDNYPAGGLARQLIYSNNRSLANLIGPKNRLALDLTHKDPQDSLNVFQFIDRELARLEARHDNRRFEFQQDKDWRNMMFFYFLFSEYRINYDAELK